MPPVDGAVEQIREALWLLGTGASDHPHDKARDKALALLDGAVGLVREGDVVLSAEEADQARAVVYEALAVWWRSRGKPPWAPPSPIEEEARAVLARLGGQP